MSWSVPVYKQVNRVSWSVPVYKQVNRVARSVLVYKQINRVSWSVPVYKQVNEYYFVDKHDDSEDEYAPPEVSGSIVLCLLSASRE